MIYHFGHFFGIRFRQLSFSPHTHQTHSQIMLTKTKLTVMTNKIIANFSNIIKSVLSPQQHRNEHLHKNPINNQINPCLTGFFSRHRLLISSKCMHFFGGYAHSRQIQHQQLKFIRIQCTHNTPSLIWCFSSLKMKYGQINNIRCILHWYWDCF